MTHTPRHPFACIILGAGAGTRFGEPKACAQLPNGDTFLATVVRLAFDSGADPIIAVTPPGITAPAPAIVVENPHGRGEQIASVRLALTRLASTRAEGVLLWPVDHPVVLVESVLAVVDEFQRTRAPVVVPVYNGRRGHPGFFARESWQDLMTIETGGAREVIARFASRLREVPVDDAGILRDIDTKADIPHDGWRTTDALS
ncbi:MAG: nucleotidyltransferase family protein [Gemmatimonadota bacterium]|nr:nucleotidyltransferase family protein [Gemmatimonadota bacterium]